jgi:hypothetical protein
MSNKSRINIVTHALQEMEQIYLNDYPGSASRSLQARRGRTKPETISFLFTILDFIEQRGKNPNLKNLNLFHTFPASYGTVTIAKHIKVLKSARYKIRFFQFSARFQLMKVLSLQLQGTEKLLKTAKLHKIMQVERKIQKCWLFCC